MSVPSLVPQLSPGAHRSPRRGACFMEFASYLAGERWSDHPECTDPVLSALARGVNDGVSDARRGELVEHIPRVIGLRGDDSRIGMLVALRAAVVALPVASMDRQRTLALGIMGLRRELAQDIPSALDAAAADALTRVPDATAWATAYLATVRAGSHPLHSGAMMAITRVAAVGIAEACIDDPDTLLIGALLGAIADVENELAAPVATETARVLVTT